MKIKAEQVRVGDTVLVNKETDTVNASRHITVNGKAKVELELENGGLWRLSPNQQVKVEKEPVE